jgi:hypothetical protein
MGFAAFTIGPARWQAPAAQPIVRTSTMARLSTSSKH